MRPGGSGTATPDDGDAGSVVAVTTEYVDCWTLPEFAIETHRGSVPVYLDGEVVALEGPLQYRTRPEALRVILPE